MRSIRLLLAFTSVCALAEERTFTFTNTASERGFNEAVTVMKGILKSSEITFDEAQRTITLRGSNDDVELGNWLYERLDGKSGPGQVRFGTSGEVVAVYSLASAVDTQGFQEEATAIRSVGEIRQVYAYNQRRLMVVRGTAVQVELAEWLVGEFDKALAGTGTAMTRTFPELDAAEKIVAVLYMKNAADVAGFQSSVTQLRRATRIRRVFTYNAPRVLVVRGTADQIADAERLVAAETNRN